jgi:hypothetical protein
VTKWRVDPDHDVVILGASCRRRGSHWWPPLERAKVTTSLVFAPASSDGPARAIGPEIGRTRGQVAPAPRVADDPVPRAGQFVRLRRGPASLCVGRYPKS